MVNNQQTYMSQECLPESKYDQPQLSRVMSAKQWEVQEPESSIYERSQSTTEGRVEFFMVFFLSFRFSLFLHCTSGRVGPTQ